MTDRFDSLTVVLEADIRTDDAEHIINAIQLIKGVLSVDPHVRDLENHIAYMRVRNELSERLWGVLYPKEKESI